MEKRSTHHNRKKIVHLFAVLVVVTVVFLIVLFAYRVQEVTGVSTSSSLISTPQQGATCASHVKLSSWEPRSDNSQANYRVPTAQQLDQLASWGNPDADAIRKQITGNFKGTTDGIFQWAACKWGVSADLIRAQAIGESNWHQNNRGDWTTDRRLCPPDTWEGTGCYQSYGILQIKYINHSTAWPMIRDDTAFNVDYAYALIRACYGGWVDYLYARTPVSGYPHYHAGDLWGCIGVYYSGGWYDQGALSYINQVKDALANKVWLDPWF